MMLLAGGGHSHVLVLADFARRRLTVPVAVVSPDRHTTYTGMVPGILAGQYAPHEAQIDVESLAHRAGASFIAGRVARVDAGRRIVELTASPAVSYDLLSFDIGARAAPAPADAGAPLIAL
jgi:selenide,water dikinase